MKATKFKRQVDKGLRELDRGKGISHQAAKAKLRKWLTPIRKEKIRPASENRSSKSVIFITPTGEYPSQWDDLIDASRRTIATIYTEQEAKKNHLARGIKKGKDGVYDIVVDAAEINHEMVRNALTKLAKKTSRSYRLKVNATAEDRIVNFANRLMRPLGKYGNPKRGYDFSWAVSPKQKGEVIGIWIGEILYEALVYKDVKTAQSLTRMIQIEIEDLIKQLGREKR